MKRSLYVGMAALAVAAVVGTLVYAEGETSAATCPCVRHIGSAVMKDAEIAVQNTAEGVTITVTAANADQVKAIQACFANFGKGVTAPCGMVMDTAACQKAHAAGSCTGHTATNAPSGCFRGRRGCW
jgi:uncharacterized protein with PIN domain